MAGINLLDQLKGKKSSGGLSATPQTTNTPKMNFSMGGGDSIGLILRVLFLVIVGYGGFLGLQRYQDEESAKVQGELTQIQESLNQENKKKNQMKNVGEEMRGYQVRKDELQGKLKAVSQQETDRSFLIRALEYVAVEMPKELWLNEVSATRSGTGGAQGQEASATFKGYAINAQAVSDFIQKLEASVYFPSTTLSQLELVPGAEVGSTNPGNGVIPVPPNSRRFQIMAKLGE